MDAAGASVLLQVQVLSRRPVVFIMGHPSKSRTSAEVLHRGHLCLCTCTITYMKHRGQPRSTRAGLPATTSPPNAELASDVTLEEAEECVLPGEVDDEEALPGAEWGALARS